MSEFFDAVILKCPHCKTRFASCEGPLCDCLDYESGDMPLFEEDQEEKGGR